MAILTKAQLEALNQSSFPDNSTEAITPAILRTYNTSTIDTLVDSLDTGSFTTDAEFNAFTSSVNAKFATIGSQSGSWGGGGSGSIVGYATTGSNTFVGNQTIQTSGTQNGIFYKTGSSEFFVGQRSNGNFSISSSAESRIIDINPSSGWVEHYTQTNFNQNVSLRGTTDVRNINTTTGLGFVAQFDNFTASLQNGYAWVGKGDGTSVSVPTASFAGATPIGVATTGSNTFNGNQTITGSLNVSGSEYITGGNKLYIQRDTQGAQQFLRLGATDNTYNFAFIVTGSDTNPGQQVWGINTAGGIWANSFDAGVVFNSFVTASQGINISNGTFSAPLQQGYVWVGNANGRTTTVPTSSFGGGGGSTFPYTGNAQFTGSISQTAGTNTFNGATTINNDLIVANGGGANIGGTLLAQSGIQVLNGSGIEIKANAQGSGSAYPNVTSTVDNVTDPSNVYASFQLVDQSGNALIAIAANSYTPQYPNTTIPILFGGGNNPGGDNAGIAFPSNGQADHWKKSNFKYGVDVTGSLLVNGLNVSSSIALNNQKWNNIASQSGSWGGGGTINTGSFATTGSNNFTGGQTILNGGGIELKANTQGSGSAYASITTTVDNVTDPANVYSSYQLVDQSGNALIAIAANSYTAEYPNTTIPYLFGGGNNPGGTNAGIAFTANGQADYWKKSNFKYGVSVTGSLNVTGSIFGTDNLSVQNGITSSGQVNIVGGAGLSIAANTKGSGSAYAIATAVVDDVTDPTNVYSAFQLVGQGGNSIIAIAANSYTGEYPNTTIPMLFGGGNNPDGSNAGIAFPSNGNMDVWKKTNFKYPATFTTGSNKQAGTATLNGGNPGTVTVSNSLVTANSIIMLTKQDNSHDGYVSVSAKSNGSFTITSSGNGDASVVGWFIINNS